MAANKGNRSESLHDLSRKMPSADEFARLMDDVEKMDDRAAALILAALLDNLLEEAIECKFIPLGERSFDSLFRNPTAPLASFSSKIAMAHALGVIGNEPKAQLNRIRSIRNTFAHSVLHVSFDHETIKFECIKLDPQRLERRRIQLGENPPPRQLYITTSHLLAILLMRQIKAMLKERRYGQYGHLFWQRPSSDKV